MSGEVLGGLGGGASNQATVVNNYYGGYYGAGNDTAVSAGGSATNTAVRPVSSVGSTTDAAYRSSDRGDHGRSYSPTRSGSGFERSGLQGRDARPLSTHHRPSRGGDLTDCEIASAGRRFDRLMASDRSGCQRPQSARPDGGAGRGGSCGSNRSQNSSQSSQHGCRSGGHDNHQRSDASRRGGGRDSLINKLLDILSGGSGRSGGCGQAKGGRGAGGRSGGAGNVMSDGQLDQIRRLFDRLSGAGQRGGSPAGGTDPLRSAAQSAIDFLKQALGNGGQAAQFTNSFAKQALMRGDSVRLSANEFNEVSRQLSAHKGTGTLSTAEYDEAVRQFTSLRDAPTTNSAQA